MNGKGVGPGKQSHSDLGARIASNSTFGSWNPCYLGEEIQARQAAGIIDERTTFPEETQPLRASSKLFSPFTFG